MTILVCTDGQPHSDTAIAHAISLARAQSAELVALYVIDPWLKQFSSEIYAQGRQEYLDYVVECQEAEAIEAKARFGRMCESCALNTRFMIREGDPLATITEVLSLIMPSTVVLGGKKLTRWGMFRSQKLPVQLRRTLRSQVSAARLEQVA